MVKLLEVFLDKALAFLPAVIAVAGVTLAIVVARFLLNKRYAGRPNSRFQIQLITLLLSFVGLLVIILTLPLSDTRTGQLLSLIGILLSAAIALSSTTFLGNIMAGLMLRAVRSFRPGDFVRVGEQFGRVSEQGLFHTEIQTEDRDLTTMPNLYLVTNPVKVIRASGTLITAEVSLGYDVPRTKVEPLLLEAAEATGLTEPFVQVMQLGDFSITYRVAGLLTEVKHVISSRSRLHENMLDSLHNGGVEIVSPTFMNTRAFDPGREFIPKESALATTPDTPKVAPESVVFDKADEAESLEKLQERYDTLGTDIEQAREQLKEASTESDKARLEAEISRLEQSREHLADYITQRSESDRKD
ncbi:mechanosensitive ion channel [candidate division GN15 bacterium]|nr:mechanosensitive ion channel [candidate division GN15 bacterium]